MLITIHVCHRNLNSVTNIESSIPRCHQHQYCRFRLIKSHFRWEVWKRQRSKSKDQNFWSTRIDDLKFRKNWKKNSRLRYFRRHVNNEYFIYKSRFICIFEFVLGKNTFWFYNLAIRLVDKLFSWILGSLN